MHLNDSKHERKRMGMIAGRWVVLCALAAFASVAFAGQSLDLTGISSVSVPNPGLNGAEQAWRVEWQWHDYEMTQVVAALRFCSLGFLMTTYNSSTHPPGLVHLVACGNRGEMSVISTQFGLKPSGLFRVQRDPILKRYTAEAWDLDGTNYRQWIRNYEINGESDSTWTGMNAIPETKLAFLRIFDNVVPLGSKPPTTVAGGNVAEWKFDGDLKDSAPGGLGSISLSGAAYENTAGQDTVSIVAETRNTPYWAPFRPLRAGFPNELNATRSFSLADAGDEVSCTWTQVDGPSIVKWTGRDTCQPTVNDLVFGSYDFRVCGTNVNSVTTCVDVSLGAVAYDENGVVIYPDERLYDLLGPTTVLGSNPWEWMDSQHVAMAKARWVNYSINGGTWESEWNPPNRTVNGIPREGLVWIDNRAGKVYGIGTNFLQVFTDGRPGPPLLNSAGGSPWLMAEAGRVADLPTVLRNYTIANVDSDTEITLTQAGGWFDVPPETPVPWTTWRMNNTVEGATGTVYAFPSREIRKVYGIGTNFLAEFCGGEVGPATSNLQRISIGGATAALRFRVESCQSNTELTLFEDFTGDAISSPGVPWRRQDAVDRGEWSTHNGPASFVNYYDAVAAYYSLYLRTGWKDALNAARFVHDGHWKHPFAVPRNRAYLGSLIAFLWDTGHTTQEDHDLFWKTAHTVSNSFSCKFVSDIRESAYAYEHMAFIAKYSPDADERTSALNKLAACYATGIQPFLHPTGAVLGAGYSASNAEASGRWWEVTIGSATVTKVGGDDVPANFCGEPASFYSTGTLAIGGDKRTVTLSGGDWTGQGGKIIYLRGTRNGQPFSHINFIQKSPAPDASGGLLRYPWPGDGDPTAYRAQTFQNNRQGMMTFKVDWSGELTEGDVVDMGIWHWCTVDSGSQLTLDRPWEGPTGFRRFRFTENGSMASTLMYGIFAMGMYRVADALAEHYPSVAANYRFAGDEQIRFLEETHTQYTGTPNFAYFPMHSAMCHPREVWPNVCFGSATTPESFDRSIARAYATETMRAIAMRYLHTRDSIDRDRGEAWSTALFAREGFAAPAPGDGNYTATLTGWTMSATQLTKNFGQAFGQGGSQVWSGARHGRPASRGHGRPASPKLKNSTVPFDDNEAPMAASYRVNVFFPSGQKQQTVCAESPCTVQVDPRQGTHLITKEWLDASGKVIHRSDPEPIVFPAPGRLGEWQRRPFRRADE